MDQIRCQNGHCYRNVRRCKKPARWLVAYTPVSSFCRHEGDGSGPDTAHRILALVPTCPWHARSDGGRERPKVPLTQDMVAEMLRLYRADAYDQQREGRNLFVEFRTAPNENGEEA